MWAYLGMFMVFPLKEAYFLPARYLLQPRCAIRGHQGIGQQIPEASRSALPSHHAGEKVIALPVVGGLYHDYRWAA
jgi:hypothetical protein